MKRFVVVLVSLLALCGSAYAQKKPKQSLPPVSESAQAVRTEIKNLIRDMSKIDAQLIAIVFGKYACNFERFVELSKSGLTHAERWQRLIPHAEYPLKQFADETLSASIHVHTYRSGLREHQELLRARNNTGCPERAA